MSEFGKPVMSVGAQFGGATQPKPQERAQDWYGDHVIGYEAGVLTANHYVTAGVGKEPDLPPGSTSKPCVIDAPLIPTGYNFGDN